MKKFCINKTKKLTKIKKKALKNKGNKINKNKLIKVKNTKKKCFNLKVKYKK